MNRPLGVALLAGLAMSMASASASAGVSFSFGLSFNDGWHDRACWDPCGSWYRPYHAYHTYYGPSWRTYDWYAPAVVAYPVSTTYYSTPVTTTQTSVTTVYPDTTTTDTGTTIYNSTGVATVTSETTTTTTQMYAVPQVVTPVYVQPVYVTPVVVSDYCWDSWSFGFGSRWGVGFGFRSGNFAFSYRDSWCDSGWGWGWNSHDYHRPYRGPRVVNNITNNNITNNYYNTPSPVVGTPVPQPNTQVSQGSAGPGAGSSGIVTVPGHPGGPAGFVSNRAESKMPVSTARENIARDLASNTKGPARWSNPSPVTVKPAAEPIVAGATPRMDPVLSKPRVVSSPAPMPSASMTTQAPASVIDSKPAEIKVPTRFESRPQVVTSAPSAKAPVVIDSKPQARSAPAIQMPTNPQPAPSAKVPVMIDRKPTEAKMPVRMEQRPEVRMPAPMPQQAAPARVPQAMPSMKAPAPAPAPAPMPSKGPSPSGGGGGRDHGGKK